MRKRSAFSFYASASLVPGFFAFHSIGAQQALCDFARERALCLRENAWGAEWWKVLLAMLVGCLLAAIWRSLLSYQRPWLTGTQP